MPRGCVSSGCLVVKSVCLTWRAIRHPPYTLAFCVSENLLLVGMSALGITVSRHDSPTWHTE
jgi:hypothetical protein